MAFNPVPFENAPPGWVPGDPIPEGATRLNAEALLAIQENQADYAETLIEDHSSSTTDEHGVEDFSKVETLIKPVWSHFGEPGVGGRITAIGISPHDSQRIIVTSDMFGIGLSEDGGKTWQTTTGLPSWEMGAITFHPYDPKIIWVGSMSGPVKTIDGGHTWVVKDTGLPAKASGGYPYTRPTERILIDPTNTTKLLLFMGNNRSWKTSTSDVQNYGKVFESVNSGDSWTLKGTVGADVNITGAVRAAADFSILYASTSTIKVLKSTDGGSNWTSASTGLVGNSVRQIAADPTTGRVWGVQGGASGGIYLTTDGGANWVQKSSGISLNASASFFHVHRAADGTLYTADIGVWASGQRIYKSVNDGDTWTNISPASMARFYPAGLAPYWITTDPQNSNFVMGGTSDVLMASIDAGVTWYDSASELRPNGRRRGTGWSGLLGTRVTFSKWRKGLMLLNAFDAGHTLRTADGGNSFHRPTAGSEQYLGAYDSAFGGIRGEVAVTIHGQTNNFQGIYVSTDYGETFTIKQGSGVGLPAKGAAQSRSYGSVAFGSRDGSVIYAVLPSGDLYKSTNTGASFTLLKSDVEAYCVAVSPDFSTVYLGTTTGVYSGDGSSSGSFSLIGSSPRATRIVFDPVGVMYLVTHKAGGTSVGLHRYEDGVFTRLVNNQYVKDVAIDPYDPDRIAIATQDDPFNDTSNATGIFLSKDRGTTFLPINNGLPMLRARSIAWNPWVPGELVTGTDGRGFWIINVDRQKSPADTMSERVSLEVEVALAEIETKATLSINPADIGKAMDAAGGPPIEIPTQGTSGLPTVQHDGSTYPSRPVTEGPVLFVGPASQEPASQQVGDFWFAEDET